MEDSVSYLPYSDQYFETIINELINIDKID